VHSNVAEIAAEAGLEKRPERRRQRRTDPRDWIERHAAGWRRACLFSLQRLLLFLTLGALALCRDPDR
jgi:hypothetical protein